MFLKSIFVSFALLITTQTFASQTRSYELKIHHCHVNISGKKEVDFAICINGSIPAPTLEFHEGDFAEIKVINLLTEETSLHWHGILLPNEMDGVSYVTTQPIQANAEHIFRFPIRQAGTYWYHSHTGLQEQRGAYGAIVIHPKQTTIKADREHVVVLSDWSDENPDRILCNLKKDGDYYRFKKNRFPSLYDAWEKQSLPDWWDSEWSKMGAMDLSDVGYDRFLINGKVFEQLDLKPGETIRLRLINAAASSYFFIQLGKRPFQVVASDGLDIHPVMVNELLMAMGETYDVLVTAEASNTKPKAIELRATAQDVTGYVSLRLGLGELESPPARTIPNPYKMMTHSGSQSHEDHQQHQQHNSVSPVFTPLEVKNFPQDANIHSLRFRLTGDMERYTWSLENSELDTHKSISVKKGEIVRLELNNETMMHHPMHLHGHFFKVLANAGSTTESPVALKHTLDVPPHSRKTIEFYADEPGVWLFHCHNLYHMKSGMDAKVSYADYRPSIALPRHQDPHLHEHIYAYGYAEVFTTHSSLYLRASDSKWQLDHLSHYDFKEKDYSGDLRLHRWIDSSNNVFVGLLRDHNDTGIGLGIYHLWPLRIHSEISIDTIHNLDLKLKKELVLWRELESELSLDWNQDQGIQPELALFYSFNWHIRAGLQWSKRGLGLGVRAQF